MNRTLLSSSLALAFGLASTHANDWPEWGGRPMRNMYSEEKGLPDRFDPGKTSVEGDVDLKTTKNVKWVAKLGSQSYGNVTVSGGKVFVGTNNDSPRDSKYQGDRSILMVFDEKTGEFLWQLVIPKLAAGKVNDWENLGLLSSPTVDGDRVYFVSSRCEVVCADVNGLANGNDGPFMEEAQYIAGPGKPKVTLGPKDGDIIWRYDMIDELGVYPHNASNCSVLVVDGVVYSCTSNGVDWTHSNIPAPMAPSFIALDQKTGQFLGEDDSHISQRIFHGQWSSPSLAVVNGKKLIIFGGGDGFCYAFDPKPVKQGDDAVLRTVWKCDCNPPEYKFKDGKPIKYPAADGPSEINATPVFYKNRVYIAIGQDPEHGEGVGRLLCIDATKSGDVTKSGVLWDYRGIHRSMSTVSIDPESGLLFVGDFSGFIHCLDAETGKLYWTHDLKSHMWGSTMVADGKVYAGDEDGDLVVLAASKEKKVLSEANLGSPVYSTPVVANGTVYVASTTQLFAVSDTARNAANTDQPAKVDIK
jgi:outer membrane protein assembly factor BamB